MSPHRQIVPIAILFRRAPASLRRGWCLIVADVGDRRQVVDYLLGHEKGHVEGGEADRDDDEQNIEIGRAAVDPAQHLFDQNAIVRR